jgi:hypothetical protein
MPWRDEVVPPFDLHDPLEYLAQMVHHPRVTFADEPSFDMSCVCIDSCRPKNHERAIPGEGMTSREFQVPRQVSSQKRTKFEEKLGT